MFKNKVIAITGAGSGIGRALAINLAERGARLAVSDINEESLRETVSLLPSGVEAKYYVVDVSSKEEVFKFADDVDKDFGATHYIFNNAGTSIFGTVENISLDEMQRVIDINMWGVIYGTKAFLPKMLSQKEGSIINVSSVFGLVSAPCQVAYNVSKFAVRGFTETLWSELKDTGVKAFVVHPGGIDTGIDSAPLCVNGGAFETHVKESSVATLITPPAECAQQIVNCLIKGKSRMLVGSGAKLLHLITRLFPNSYMKIIGPKVGL